MSLLPDRPGFRHVATLALAIIAAGCASSSQSALSTSSGSGSVAASPRRVQASPPTALDRYVNRPDPAYSWKVAGSVRGEGATAYAIDMTSQTWLTTNEVNRTVWRHWLTVVKPDNLAHSTALLFISGGSNKDTTPPRPTGELVKVALATKSVVAELKQVPNQALVFGGDGRERVEDDLIAYTWDKFLRTGDERWPARLPMTKAAVRALDTITAFCASEQGGKSKVDTFVVAGGSKRGWTTWTTAITDPRVVAICPIVIDVLNLEPSMTHHYQAYGFYAPAVGNYTEQHIMDWIGTPQMKSLMQIEDPFSYRARLTLPKLIMNSCGDQFFLPDSSQFYFSQLPGVKYLRYVPNTDHGLKGSDAYETLAAWHHATLNADALPKFTWKHEAPGVIKVAAPDHPKEVKLWQATNPAARDFRLETLGPVWKSTTLTDAGGGSFVGKVEKPAAGYTAYMVELTYDIGAPTPLKVTTDVRVFPDSVPFAAPRHGAAPKTARH